jgi:hypothetical protein
MLGQLAPTAFSGEKIFKNAFRGTGVVIGDAGNSLARIAFNFGAGANVPPRSLGGTGKTVYLRSGGFNASTFVHELGHVLDFRLGSDYDPITLMIQTNPSTALLIATGGSYEDSPCEGLKSIPSLWGTCMVSTDYGATNHFEDFADTWEQWVLLKTREYHTYSPELAEDNRRIRFMDEQVRWFLFEAARVSV